MSKLYCGNSDCGEYLGSMGADSCVHCGWIDPEAIEAAAAEPLLQRIAELEHQLDAMRAQIGQGEPDGWQLVPKEPTDEMVRAALHLDLSYMPGHDGPDRAAVYKAMLASTHPAPQQIGQCDMQIRVLFECVENGVTGTTSAPVKRVEWEDDGTLTAVLDYWPPPAPKHKPLTDEQSRELAEQHYVCSPWYDTNPASVIGSRQWCAYWDGWRAAIGIKGE